MVKSGGSEGLEAWGLSRARTRWAYQVICWWDMLVPARYSLVIQFSSSAFWASDRGDCCGCSWGADAERGGLFLVDASISEKGREINGVVVL